jgi:hypothetical protein
MQVKYCQIIIFLQNMSHLFRAFCELNIVDLASSHVFANLRLYSRNKYRATLKLLIS